MGKHIYFTPGPSQLYHTYDYHLKKAMNEEIGSISHRSTAFQKIYEATETSLRELLDIPEDFKILFLSSATDIWERILQNLVAEKSHHFVNGAFSKRFYEFAIGMGKKSTQEVADPGQEFASFEVPEGSEVIGVTQNETSTGYAFDLNQLKAIREKNPEALISLDVVSSIPSVPTPFDLIDTTYFSVQKSFGMPAGLGVWIINQKAIDRAIELENQGATGTYRKLSTLVKSADKHQTPETPNVVAIYILGKIAEDMIGRGIKMVRNETVYKSTILYQTLESSPLFTPFVRDKKNRSKTIIVTETPEQSRILEDLEKKKIILGKGYGAFKNDHLRIANFPAHSKEQVEMLCDLLAAY
ncbi:MAG: aminotransferase class V-fold PLP-dependent enzyme [Cytophagales bacterium]|nr:aminotransferase class V-fold PLP-dependent enzyme [Cytophagales bacterium]